MSRKMIRWFIAGIVIGALIAFLAIAVGLATQAHAATSIYTSPEKTIVYFVCGIAAGDDAIFRNALSDATTTVVFVDNPGGLIAPALSETGSPRSTRRKCP